MKPMSRTTSKLTAQQLRNNENVHLIFPSKAKIRSFLQEYHTACIAMDKESREMDFGEWFEARQNEKR
jgi:hypothetical protein